MSEYVSVSFGPHADYQFQLNPAETADLSREEARAWLQGEFQRLGCTPTNPVGKLLVLEMVLEIARAIGQEGFGAQPEWARRFAIASLIALDRASLIVDVQGATVG